MSEKLHITYVYKLSELEVWVADKSKLYKELFLVKGEVIHKRYCKSTAEKKKYAHPTRSKMNIKVRIP